MGRVCVYREESLRVGPLEVRCLVPRLSFRPLLLFLPLELTTPR